MPAPPDDKLTAIQEFDLTQLPDSFYLNPYPTYRALREYAHTHWCPDGSLFLSRYEDVNLVYRNPRLFSSDKQKQFEPLFGNGPLFEHHTTSLVFNDPPLHTHVRRAIGNALAPKVVSAMAPAVESLAEELLQTIEGLGSEFDLIEDFAGAIPVEVIGNLLSIPREERGPLQRWSLAILGALEPAISPEQLDLGNRCVTEFLAYLEGLVARRRKSLQADEDDLLARLLRWEQDGYQLDGSALYHQCIFLLNAGHETTTNLIANGTLTLLAHPAALAELREEPELIDSAVEEMLRFESPNQLGNRMATQATEVGGTAVPAGTVLTLCIGGTNRDPAVFENPESFDIHRDPNPHLAFGGGIHTCAGLAVARMEARIAIARLIERFPGLHCQGEPLRARRARFRNVTRAPMKTA